MKRIILYSIWVVALAMMGNGCAFVDQKVDLTYQNPVTHSHGGGGLQIAKPTEITMARNSKNQIIIGTVRNGFGMKTADTVTDNSIGDWVVQALKTELESAGYQIKLFETLPSDSGRGIQIAVNRVWVEHEMNFWTVGAAAEVGFEMTLVKDGQTFKKVVIQGRGNPQSMTGGNAAQKGEGLRLALQDCMQKAVPEIAAAFPAE